MVLLNINASKLSLKIVHSTECMLDIRFLFLLLSVSEFSVAHQAPSLSLVHWTTRSLRAVWGQEDR